jgi:hypothetical protein
MLKKPISTVDFKEFVSAIHCMANHDEIMINADGKTVCSECVRLLEPIKIEPVTMKISYWDKDKKEWIKIV